MKRSIGKLLLGCAAVLAGTVSGFFLWFYGVAPDARHQEGAAIIAVFFGVVGVLLGLGWVVWSALDWTIRRVARVRAIEALNAAARGPGVPLQGPQTAANGPGVPGVVPACDGCSAGPAVAQVLFSGYLLCAACAAAYDWRTAGIERLNPYSPQGGPGERPRPGVATPGPKLR